VRRWSAQSRRVRSWLYPKRLAAVILAAAAGLAALWWVAVLLNVQGVAQLGRKPANTGPRAVGLVQLSSTGKARLIPIVIMMDGKFFDAGSYKASPVPMALDFGVVYEGFKTGVSQGTFTITQPGQLNHNWIAEGTWLPAGVKAQPENTRKYAPPVIADDSKDDRPVLHRRAEGAADKDEAKPATSSSASPSTPAQSSNPSSQSGSSAPAQPTTTSSQSGTQTQPASNPAASTNNTSAATSKEANKETAKATTPPASRASDLDEPISDPNRPRLRRGKPDSNAHHEPFVDFDAEETAKNPSDASKTPKDAAAAPMQTFAAVSDAGGPDPRPYTYDVKPAEETIYRNKMLDLAATLMKPKAVQGGAGQGSSAAVKAGAAQGGAGAKAPAKTAKPSKPQFEEVNLRIFDLSNSNEPVLVLSARTPVPPANTTVAQLPQEITLIARTDLEGELQKLFFAQTDAHHLDVSPRMELIDAVDADGDGRGELLFRRTFDAGSAYAIYRVTADGLWPLYEPAL